MKHIVESASTRLKETARGYVNRKHLDLAVVVADQIDYKIASLSDKDVERFSKRIDKILLDAYNKLADIEDEIDTVNRNTNR